MYNNSIDFYSLKKSKHFNPLFEHSSKALPTFGHPLSSSALVLSDEIRKTHYYIVIDSAYQLDQQLFQCKYLAPVFIFENQSYILVKGQNLWDYYRSKKDNSIILTEEEIWILAQQIIEALIKLKQYGLIHTHLREYAIYRQSAYHYQLIFHPSIKSMLELAQSDNFYWYDFYLSPEQLKANSKTSYRHTEKDCIFSLGLLILNVMNSEDFNRDVYSKKRYEIDWEVVEWKIKNAKRKYSDQLLSFVHNCVKQSANQRYGNNEALAQVLTFINHNNSSSEKFKYKINSMIDSKIHSSSKKSPSSKKQSSGQKSTEKQKTPNANNTFKVSSPQKKQTHPKSSPSTQPNDEKIKIQQKAWTQFQTNEVKAKKWMDQSNEQTIQKPTQIHNAKFQGEDQKKLKIQISKIQPFQNQQQKLNKGLIGFQRGTFGGELESPKFNMVQKHNFHDLAEKPLTNGLNSFSNEQKFMLKKIHTFNDKYQQHTNQSVLNSKDEQSLQTLKKQKQQPLTNSNKKQSNYKAQIKQNAFGSKIFTIEEIKQKQKQFAGIYEDVQQIKDVILAKSNQITFDSNDCLQPLQILEKIVSESHGVYIDGNRYFGAFQNGRRNGLGLQVFLQNEYYFGSFKDDLFHGQGFYFWNKNQYFLGLFQNGKKVFGNLLGPNFNYCGQFNGSKRMNGIGKIIYKTGQVFTGNIKEGKKHGIGEQIQITNDKFVGFWEKGKKSGYGEHVSNNFPLEGYTMKGIWKNHDLISEAIIEYANGNIYEGSLSDFEKHGKGLYKFKKGGYFIGTFYHNEATHGQLVYRNGQKYVGSLRNMKRHGFGQYHYLDQTVKKGNWIDDVRVQKDAIQS